MRSLRCLQTQDLMTLFGNYGEVSDAFIPTDKESGRPRGFAFVTMSSGSGDAINALNETEFMVSLICPSHRQQLLSVCICWQAQHVHLHATGVCMHACVCCVQLVGGHNFLIPHP